MRKIIIGAVAAAAALSFAPASADPGHGCQVIGGGVDNAGTCSYVSNGSATTLFALTPNHVDVTYPDPETGEAVSVYSNGSADPAAQGPHDVAAIPAGVTVTLTVGPDDAEVVSGHVGIVIIAETE